MHNIWITINIDRFIKVLSIMRFLGMCLNIVMENLVSLHSVVVVLADRVLCDGSSWSNMYGTSKRWNYLMRTTLHISEHLEKIEACI